MRELVAGVCVAAHIGVSPRSRSAIPRALCIRCLGRLNEKMRDIFLARRVDGLTYKEVGKRHGMSTSTVEKYVARAALQITTWMEGW